MNKKNKTILLILNLLLISFLYGCSESDEKTSVSTDSTIEESNDNNISNTITMSDSFDAKYYGQWIRIDTAQSIDILSSTIIDNSEPQNDNLIKVIDENSSVYYLARASVSDIKVRGNIEDSISQSLSSSRATTNIGSIDVVLENVLDSNIKIETSTDENGDFEAEGLPAGTYSIVATQDDALLNSTIDIKNKLEDIGSFKLTGDDLYNFKAELILDEEFIYANEHNYSAKIRIHNISDAVGYGLSYDIDINDVSLQSFSKEVVKGSIEASKYADIPITFSFNQLLENSKSISVEVNIQDVNRVTWNDTFEFNLYKGFFNINIATEENRVKGYVIMPDTHKMKIININGEDKIKLPLLSNEVYHMLLSNPSFEFETAYSLGINKGVEDFIGFDDTPVHEPNNQESTASVIELNQNTLSYLHASDIDYWKIVTPESEYLFDADLASFVTQTDVNLSQVVVSNAITITEKLTNGATVPVSINKGTIILNGIDTNKTNTTITTDDTIAIKLQASNQINTQVTSTMLIGLNVVNFTVDTHYKINFNSPSIIIVDEHQYEVMDINATSDDSTKISYFIVESSEFSIAENTGNLRFLQKPYYEEKSSYNLKIKAMDDKGNSRLQDVVVLINNNIYRDNDRGVVVDNNSELMWQDDYYSSSITITLVHNEGVSYCSNLVLGDYNNWTLPTISQLSSLLDYEKNPKIFTEFNNINVTNTYWSITDSEINYHTSYDTLNFESGVTTQTDTKTFPTNVSNIRCVRSLKIDESI